MVTIHTRLQYVFFVEIGCETPEFTSATADCSRFHWYCYWFPPWWSRDDISSDFLYQIDLHLVPFDRVKSQTKWFEPFCTARIGGYLLPQSIENALRVWVHGVQFSLFLPIFVAALSDFPLNSNYFIITRVLRAKKVYRNWVLFMIATSTGENIKQQKPGGVVGANKHTRAHTHSYTQACKHANQT